MANATDLNSRQKYGIGLGISGAISLAVGILITFTPNTAWIKGVLDVMAYLAPLTGLVINFPKNTDPQ